MNIGSLFGFGGLIVGGIVGSLFGQPALGAAIGGSIGGILGATLFPEKFDIDHPTPPKPKENREQIATYGASIPVVFNYARLAGNIIYMQPVQQTLTQSKHRQDGRRYYEYNRIYTSTFAVAFCEGPVIGINKMWVNNDIWLDYSDFSSTNYTTSTQRETQYLNIYLGTEAQTYDLSIANIITAANTPAYKGICYIVFKDFPIGEYGSIPKIEVEISERDQPTCNEAVSYSDYSFSGFTEEDPDNRMTVGSNSLAIINPTESIIRLYRTGLSLANPWFRYKFTVTTYASSGSGVNFSATFSASGEAASASARINVSNSTNHIITIDAVSSIGSSYNTVTINSAAPVERYIQIRFEENYIYVDVFTDSGFSTLEGTAYATTTGWPEDPTVNAIYIIKSLNTAPDVEIHIDDFKSCIL